MGTAYQAGDQSANEQIHNRGESPVDSDRDPCVVEAEEAIERTRERASPVVDRRDDGVARTRLQHHQQNSGDDDGHDDRDDEAHHTSE